MPAIKPNIAALVEQMPDTDKDIQAKQEEARQQAQPAGADKAKPKPDRFGSASKFTGPEPAVAEKVFAEILSGGRESLLELINLVREPRDADYKSYKPSYVLHALVIHAGSADNAEQRRLIAEAIASQLGSDTQSKAVKGFLIRELRILGGKEVVRTLGKHLLDEELCDDVAHALLSIREGAASQFRSALKNATARNRVTIIQALGVLRDTESATSLKRMLNDDNQEVRRTAAWALANLGEASAADALLKAADASEGWERTQASKACLLLAERLAASGRNSQAVRIYAHLRDTRKDATERHVRDAAERALSATTH